jgi:nanoRNase/pAp phosphatase (c-di-AMP/oligoRNAs hydrolase)
LEKYSIDIRNTEQLIENIRGIDGVTVAALLKSTKSPGIYKISLRSKDPRISVGKVARRLNGGGHETAAGGTIFAKSLEDAENILLKHVEQEMKNETQP